MYCVSIINSNFYLCEKKNENNTMYILYCLPEWVMCCYTVLVTTPERFWNTGMNLRRKCYPKPYIIVKQNYVSLNAVKFSIALYCKEMCCCSWKLSHSSSFTFWNDGEGAKNDLVGRGVFCQKSWLIICLYNLNDQLRDCVITRNDMMYCNHVYVSEISPGVRR